MSPGNTPLLGKASSKQPSQVFNGVFYNLDALVTNPKLDLKPEYCYEDPNELYEFYEQLGEGGFSKVSQKLSMNIFRHDPEP